MKALLDFQLHLFDLDDTLIQTRPIYLAAQQAAIEQAFPHQSASEAQQRTARMAYLSKKFGSSLVDQYLDAFLHEESSDIQQRQALKEQLLQVYSQEYWGKLKIQPQAIAWLERLQKEGRFLGLVSNGIPQLQAEKLKRTGLADWFPSERQWISGNFPPACKKPSPYLLEKALAYFQVAPQGAVYYGNIAEDVIAAHLAGMQCCFLGTPEPAAPALAQPDWSIANWAALLKETPC